MKKFFLPSACFALFIIFSLQGCLKDTFTRTHTYTYYQPIYKTTQEVRSNIKSNAPQTVQNPGKFYLYGPYIFLNEIDKGVHVIDNSNPSQPQNIAFIDIPGNMDIAVKGNTLYADLYTDLVAIDITDPHHVALKKVVENIFPPRYYGTFMPDSTKIIARWEKRDTTITEKGNLNALSRRNDIFLVTTPVPSINIAFSSSAAAVSPYGVGGSTSRFAISHDRLYTVGNQNLDVFNIVQSENLINVSKKTLGWNIETIYPFLNKLFIGSQSGMFVYNISNPDNPVQEGQFSHVRSCDPVITDGKYAYVTLHSGTVCLGYTNELDVLDISAFSNPFLLKTYSMTNPNGLSKDGNSLFICDGKDGLKIYNAANPNNLQLLQQIKNIEPSDVIALNGNALVVAKDGLYQYDYSNLNNIHLTSKINIAK